MANQVYANNMEVSCKAAAGKSICAFPDVCFTPPQTPATPPGVPIPYPNTGMASDTTDGSSTVKISGQEVMLKNKSYFKRSMGDEAGCAPKKAVVTSKNMGKVYFNAWSMDVKVEGENVVRMLDITTHNHASFPGNSPTWPYLDEVAFSDPNHPCADLAKDIDKHCLDKETSGPNKGELSNDQSAVVFRKDALAKDIADRDGSDVKRAPSLEELCKKNNGKCKEAMECVVSPYSPNNCCPDKKGNQLTPHHIVPKSQFSEKGESGNLLDLDSGATYKEDKAPCICAEGHSHSGNGIHPELHQETNTLTRSHPKVKVGKGKMIPDTKSWEVGDAEAVGAQAVEEIMGCSAECTELQVRKGHRAMGINKSDKIRPTTAG
jgi:hypothetical protein